MSAAEQWQLIAELEERRRVRILRDAREESC